MKPGSKVVLNLKTVEPYVARYHSKNGLKYGIIAKEYEYDIEYWVVEWYNENNYEVTARAYTEKELELYPLTYEIY